MQYPASFAVLAIYFSTTFGTIVELRLARDVPVS